MIRIVGEPESERDPLTSFFSDITVGPEDARKVIRKRLKSIRVHVLLSFTENLSERLPTK